MLLVIFFSFSFFFFLFWLLMWPHVLLIQETHRLYIQKLDEISNLQTKCTSSISRQRKRLKEVSQLVKKSVYQWLIYNLRKTTTRHAVSPILFIRCSTGPSEEDAKTLDEVKEKIKARPNAFFEMEAFLPKKNGWWLTVPSKAGAKIQVDLITLI